MIEANIDRFSAAENFFGFDDVFGPSFARDIRQRQHESHCCIIPALRGDSNNKPNLYGSCRGVPKIAKKAIFLFAIQIRAV
jgi:hypothetical protein